MACTLHDRRRSNGLSLYRQCLGEVFGKVLLQISLNSVKSQTSYTNESSHRHIFYLVYSTHEAGCSADSYSFYKASEACDKWSKKGEAFMVIHEWWDNKARGDNTRWCRGDVNNNQILGLELVGLEPGKTYLGKHLTHLLDRLQGGCVSIQ